MKKTIAILILSIHLYNLGGYMVVFQYFIYKADKFSEEQISKERYKISELIEIKIPVRLPGLCNWNGYQNISGSVQLAQNSYNYVRMKMTQDTLYVMCIPNYKTTRLNKENIIYAKTVSEAPFNAKKQSLPVKSFVWLKYVPLTATLRIKGSEFVIRPVQKYIVFSPVTFHYDVLGQPPEAAV